MKRFLPGPIILSLFLLMGMAAAHAAEFQSLFKSPPMKYRPQPFYFWNDSVKAQVVATQMKAFRDKDGYGGFCIVYYGKNFKPEYLSPAFFKLYGQTLAAAKKLDVSLTLYDEYGFPSGGAGAKNADGVPRFKNKFPGQTLKRLDKTEEYVTGPQVVYRPLPEGKLLAVVAMDTVTFKRYDLTPLVYVNRLKWHVPKGTYKIMYFALVPDADLLVDYLDPDAVKSFISMTHQAYFERFHAYFGHTLSGSFFDEPTLYRAKGRVWTGTFNEKFRSKYGFNPATLYPALWYNIGPETEAARNLLFGFRSDLYAKGFSKEVSDWSVGHGLRATGHQDQEEVVNPVSVSGDLMKCFRYQDIPGIDKIGGDRPAERFYKIVSSAANNWDKQYVMSETFGAMGNLPVDSMYGVAMDQYAKGINKLIPHAVWYNDKDVKSLPELSNRNPLYASSLPAFNKYLSRLNVVLQAPGRHVADIAVLYPIQTLQGEHHLDGPLKSTFGGMVLPRTDYVEVSNMLIDSLGRDFTFLHPEVLDSSCRVEGSLLNLKNIVNAESFQALILPSVKTISVSNVLKIKAFYEAGGRLVFTTRLPYKSADLNRDSVVWDAMRKIFPELTLTAVGDSFPERQLSASNSNGGKAVYLPVPDSVSLAATLNALVPMPDVVSEPGKPLEYLHKVRGGKDIYFFANPKKMEYTGTLCLKGSASLKMWDPHTGIISNTTLRLEKRDNVPYTIVDVKIPAFRSVFFVVK
jgi:hypothetical protein